ncbi:helix-turn-helix domain-containing protein [Draconibacterium orientale]|uniref:helix-turn-helix domain-containing protein n=1 Tax=Draconibacterium orientale TaxID=1168034 RepID=UPI002ABD8CAB|nr:helix-turn-helix domain-containing protein [Draconibacterium orientale]
MNDLILIPIPVAELKLAISNAVKDALSEIQVKQAPESNSEDDKLLNPYELSDYLPDHPARQTIYGWVNNRMIPYEKHGRKLLFRQSTIDDWLNNGRTVSHLKEV